MFVVLWARVVAGGVKAWEWLKKNWQWVLVPIGLLLLVLKLLPKKPPPQVVSSSLIGAAETERAAEDKADAELEEAIQIRDQRAVAVVREHQEKVQDLVEKQKDDAAELIEDLQRLNTHLLNVGKEMRKP